MSTYRTSDPYGDDLYADDVIDRQPRRGGVNQTTVGYVLIAIGVIAVLVTWMQIRDIQSGAAQLPYIVSGGIIGLGLMVVGAIATFTDQRGDDRSTRALHQLRSHMTQLQDTVEWTADAVEQMAHHMNEQETSSTNAKKRNTPKAKSRSST